APYAVDDKITSFSPALFNPALGGDPCNGLAVPPGTNFCQQAGFRGGTAASTRGLSQQKNFFAPRLGLAWDVSGDGKTAVRAGLGQFYQRERLSAGLVLGGNPPFAQVQSGVRTLDSNREPCAGCFSVGNGAPNQGIDLSGNTPYNWQWNLVFEHEIVRNPTPERASVGSIGRTLLTLPDTNQVPPENRLAFAQSQDPGSSGALRPYDVFGNQRITFWSHDGKSTYHSLQTQLLSRFGRSQVQ